MPPDWYVPYKTDGSLIPRLADIGSGYRYHVTGLVHDERGFPTRRPDEVEPFYRRLFGKISRHFNDLQLAESYQMEDAEYLIIAYGCTARSAQSAMRIGRANGMKIGLLKLRVIWPFPRHQVEQALEGKRAVLVPELNMGQMSREVKRVSDGRTQVYRQDKMDGSMITPGEILNRLREIIR